jgi:hypothetical protein
VCNDVKGGGRWAEVTSWRNRGNKGRVDDRRADLAHSGARTREVSFILFFHQIPPVHHRHPRVIAVALIRRNHDLQRSPLQPLGHMLLYRIREDVSIASIPCCTPGRARANQRS